MKFFISAGIVRNIISGITQTGLDSEKLVTESKISQKEVNDQNGFIDAKKVCHLYDLIEASGHADFGVQLAEQEGHGYSVAGYITMNSPLIEDSLRNAIRFYGLVSNISKLSLEIKNNQVELIWSYQDVGSPIPRSMIDGGMFSACLMFQKALGIAYKQAIKAVCFQYKQPADISDYKRIFRSALLFQQPRNSIIFDASILSEPVLGSDSALKHLMEQHAMNMFKKLPEPSGFLEEFRMILRQKLSVGEANATIIAKHLHISTKTLQRKLKSESTVFKDQLSLVRQELAINYLSKSFSLIDITFLLAYSEQSAFTRAFKGWFNTSPSEYLKSHQSEFTP
ncbi:MAG: hypothetical protein COB67_05720 [SAR324 cluster bacterium]|uniref:HTH araC/xylS-type domain-containing protein n=1 Tax=SAR324 cluster bacterium TaxID=2024889 RepID=A0A2A4T517_9DELT|nr:MAG: hypothetical protein COB67_05720 [SAR324 cluster bacterium]